MSNCTSCNKELALNAKFCKFCGASQAVKLPSTSDDSVVINQKLTLACKKCNNELIPSAKFCKVCGTKVSAEPITELPITELPKAVILPTLQHASSQTPLKSNVTKYVIIGTLATVLIGGIGYWGLMNKRASDEAAALVEKQRTEVETQKKLDDEEAKRIAEEEKAQKKLDDEEAKRIAEEEKAAAIADAKEQKRVEDEEKLLALQQQKEEKIRLADELKKAREDLALAKLKANTEKAKLDKERERINRESRSNALSIAQQDLRNKASANPSNSAPDPQQVADGKFKAKFKGFLGIKVATRYYATEDMKNQALQLWKDEGKILEPDGSITTLTKENQAAESLIK